MEQTKNEKSEDDLANDAAKNGAYVPRLNKNHGFLHSIKRNQYQRDKFEKELKAKQEKQKEEREKEKVQSQPKKEEKEEKEENERDDDFDDYTPKIYGNRKKQVEEAPHLSPHSDEVWDHKGFDEMQQKDKRSSFGSPVKANGRGRGDRGRGRFQDQRRHSFSPQKQPSRNFERNQRNDRSQNSPTKEEKEKTERKKRDTVQAYVPPRGKYSNSSPIVLILNFEVENGKEPQTLYGDKPEVLAAQFVKNHNMDEAFVQIITNQIELNLQAREENETTENTEETTANKETETKKEESK